MRINSVPLIRSLIVATALTSISLTLHAHPFASGITGTNGSGQVSFYMNETGAVVTVTFEDSSTLNMGYLPAGPTNFSVGAHTSWSISCFKPGNGTPTQISSDSNPNSIWANASGVAANKNPKIGALFGRLYMASSLTGEHAQGVYAMNADQSSVAFAGSPGTNTWPGSINSNFKGPGRMRVAPDNTLMVADGKGVGDQNMIYAFAPDLSSAYPLLGASRAAGAGDVFGTPCAVGSLAAGNLVLYVPQAGTGAGAPPATPGDTNAILGPLTAAGDFNCVMRYNIGSGAGGLPWTKRPDYSYSVGLNGIAQLRPELDIEADGTIVAGFGRANLSNPDIQILAPVQTTNGITGDPANRAIIIGAQSTTNWLYTSGINPPFNSAPAADPWNGVNSGAGGAVGTYAGVRVSPDGQFLASVDVLNGATIAYMNGRIPDDRTIFGISDAPSGGGNSRGMDWDAADNIWISSSGAGNLRCFSLGLTTTCVSSNDWTGTNGAFAVTFPGTHASLSVVNAIGTQNYVNNLVNAGTPVPAVVRITLNTSDLTAVGPTLIPIYLSGTSIGPSGQVTSFVVTNAGSGYTSAPTVTVSGGGGNGAAATASINTTTHVVSSVNIINPGNGYTSLPTVTISGGGGSGATAGAVMWNTGKPTNFLLNTSQTPNGVTILNNGVIFPGTAFSGSNGPNWNVDVQMIPTALPVSGPETAINFRIPSGTNFTAVPLLATTLSIINTGPQVLQLTAPSPGSLAGMNRGILHDMARFVITRLGDTNGPGNDAINPIVQRSYTVTNINYYPPASAATPMAVLGTDYTAGVQNFNNAVLSDGSPGIVINPGVSTVPVAIGNPVKHTNTNLRRTNEAVVINLTNICNTVTTPGCNTNLLSSELLQYAVTTTAQTLNEFDNANGGETVLWSNPLTNAADSSNWTLVFANINQACGNYSGTPVLPLVRPNYNNDAQDPSGAYSAVFGEPVATEAGTSGISVPQSAAMAANGWTTALRLSANKDPGNAGEAGLNLYPQGMRFEGNYALRFDMYLSLADFTVGQGASAGTFPREFAAFGINHRGTNANWRLDLNPRVQGTGSYPINADGEWCCIDAGSGSITPADYDMFISPAFAQFNAGTGVPIAQNIPYNTGTFTSQSASPSFSPYTNKELACFDFTFTNYVGTNYFANAGVPNDQFSQNNNSPTTSPSPEQGVIKSPPFLGINSLGGAPDNQWVDVSLELTRQTNLTLYVAQQPVMNSSIINPIFGTANPIAPFGGVPMLGYLDPNKDITDFSAFVYYSNLRVVELSPFTPWTNQPPNLMVVTQGQSFTLSSAALFASNPLTNMWFFSNTNGPTGLNGVQHCAENGTIQLLNGGAIVTNTFAATNGTANLTQSLQTGTNYMSVWSDQAGSLTNFQAIVEVVWVNTNKTVNYGTTNTLAVVASGNSPPTAFQWMFAGTNLVASSHYLNVTTATLTLNQGTPADSGPYTCLVTCSKTYTNRANGSTYPVVASNSPAATLTVLPPPAPTNLVASVGGGNVTIHFTSADLSAPSSAFALLSTVALQFGSSTNNSLGAFTNYPGGVFTGSSGSFQVVVPQNPSEPDRYYRIEDTRH
ncbi:MAG: hypothetical protein C5B50_02175 [Verrucomicrobia bacterium]|nr:MAG: hypothetical protein C5B50_02175 [Verrucomicrobiota bacterium]